MRRMYMPFVKLKILSNFALMFILIKLRKILSLLCITLFVSHYAGTNFFSHSHEFVWGAITHSHFHTNSHHDTESGGHTNQCIILIARWTYFEYVDFSCDYATSVHQFHPHKNKIIENSHQIASIYFENLSLRAPPIF